MTTEARIADLERRLSLLEQGKHGYIVKGWAAAGRACGLSATTVRVRFKTDPEFPKPSNVRTFRRGGAVNIVPEWKLSDLVAYKTPALFCPHESGKS